jgi:hypothetical protein
LEITKKTVLSLMSVVITILTTLTLTTTIAAAYAGGDDDDDDDGKGNKQKAEDDSSAAIADCDDNEVKQAGFDCIAVAASDIDVESEPDTATLSVCKDIRGFNSEGFVPSDFSFTVTGNNPSPSQFQGDNADGCVDVTIGPGEYTIAEILPSSSGPILTTTMGNCLSSRTSETTATGTIESGQTQTCRFINDVPGID